MARGRERYKERERKTEIERKMYRKLRVSFIPP